MTQPAAHRSRQAALVHAQFETIHPRADATSWEAAGLLELIAELEDEGGGARASWPPH